MKIVVVMCDTLRRDYLGCYGNKWIRTPNFDRLAEHSTVFDRAVIGSFPTIPNRTDLFTGKFIFPFEGWGPLDRQERILAGELSGAGYVTQFYHDTMHMVNNGSFFARGFRGWDCIRGAEGDLLETLANVESKLPYPDEMYRGDGKSARQYLRNRHFWTSEEDWFVAKTSKRACEWLERNYKAKDFFLWIDTFQIHEPYDPPQWYVDMYDPGYKAEPLIHPRYDYCDYLTKAELKHVIALYAGEVSLVDTWIGRVFEKLALLGLYDETMIVVTSDHGMYLGEHGRIGKHTVVNPDDPWPLYDTVARIPLLVKMPGQKRQRRNSAIVQPPDLMPTLLDLCGVPIPPGRHGRSMKPLLTGRGRRLREYAVAGGQLGGKRGMLSTPVTIQREDGWTLIYGHPTDPPELYNVAKDPAQKKNVIKSNMKTAVELYRQSLDFFRGLGTPEENLHRVEGIF